jgi:integrase
MKGNIYPTKRGFLVWFPMGSESDIRKHFKTIELAERFLNGVRFEYDRGVLDIRDFMHSNPLGFTKLAEAWLELWPQYSARMRHAMLALGSRNVKEIKQRDLHILANELAETKASKTVFEILRCVKQFYNWLVDNDEIRQDQKPKFPEIKVSMRLRPFTDKDTQQRILCEVKRITTFNPRIYLGISFLCTYINLRPNELVSVKETDIDLNRGCILIPHPKEREPKYVWLCEDDINLLRSEIKYSQGVGMYFFRHRSDRGGAKRGQRFGQRYLYHYWRQSCRNLGLQGLDLYGGTRHTSAIALRQQGLTPESIKRAMGTKTAEAFSRYLQITAEEMRGVYNKTKNYKGVIKLSDHQKVVKPLK